MQLRQSNGSASRPSILVRLVLVSCVRTVHYEVALTEICGKETGPGTGLKDAMGNSYCCYLSQHPSVLAPVFFVIVSISAAGKTVNDKVPQFPAVSIRALIASIPALQEQTHPGQERGIRTRREWRTTDCGVGRDISEGCTVPLYGTAFQMPSRKSEAEKKLYLCESPPDHST